MTSRKLYGVAVITSALLLGGGVVWVGKRAMAEKDQVPTAATLRDAHDLSSVFRNVSKQVLPSIVSINTLGRKVETKGLEEQFGENSPFGDLFKEHPQFREMFKNAPRQQVQPQGTGSGFIIDPSGIIMTNSHVVSDTEEIKVVLQDGSEYLASDVKTDPRTDVAILRIKADHPLPAIKLGNSDLMEVGDWVLAVGSPFGLEMSVTQGIISAKGRGIGMSPTAREDFLQTDAAINPGNSGGPLINLNAEVVGINTAISSRSGGYDGVGFAIPVNMARWVGDQLVENGRVKRAYLGVQIGRVDPKVAKFLSVDGNKGAVIGKVNDGSPAANAKLQPSDVILKLDGKDVKDTRSLQGIVERLEVGKSYPMEIIRDGERMSIEVTMQEMPADFFKQMAPSEGNGDESSEQVSKSESFEELGLEVQPLTPTLAKTLGLNEKSEGVVITGVKGDSLAAKSGMAPGQIIEKVGKTPIKTVEDLKKALADHKLEEGVLFFIGGRQGGNYVLLKK